MDAIRFLEPYFLQLKAFVIHATYCIENGIHAPVCHGFWEGAMVAAFAIALLLTLLIGKRLLKEQLEYRRNEKRLKARAIIADLDTMEQHKWKTD
jgi:hypothetical protein